MKGLTGIICLTLTLALTFSLAGCGSKSGDKGGTSPEKAPSTTGADTTKTSQAAPAADPSMTLAVDETMPIDTLKAKVAKMTKENLLTSARQYKEAVLAKQDELNKAAGQIMSILGGKGGDKAPDTDALNNSLKALSDRLMVIVDRLKTMGVDVSEFTS